MLKTEAQLARTELELNAVSRALHTTHFLYHAREDTWKQYLRCLEDKLIEAIHIEEYYSHE